MNSGRLLSAKRKSANDRSQVFAGPTHFAAIQLPRMRIERALQLLEGAEQQRVFVAVVCVKRGATQVGAIQNVLHRHSLIALLFNQRYQRIFEQLPGALHAAVFFVGHCVVPFRHPNKTHLFVQ